MICKIYSKETGSKYKSHDHFKNKNSSLKLEYLINFFLMHNKLQYKFVQSSPNFEKTKM